MAISREEALRLAMKRLSDQKKAKDISNKFTGTFEQKHVDYFACAKQETWIPFRLLGNPWEAREKPSDTKLFLTSKIAVDTNNWYLSTIWPAVWNEGRKEYVPDPDWILTRFYNDVTDGEWRNPTREEKQADPNRRGVYVYKYAGSPIFERVKRNAIQGEKFQKSFYPQPRVIGNIHDPLDLEFHQRTNRSKVLCTKVNSKQREDGQVIYYPELGIPLSLYDELVTLAGATEGLFSEFDVAVRLLGKTYKVLHYSTIEIPKEIRSVMNGDPIPDYDLWDLDELVPVTRYSTIKKLFGKMFSEWDAYAKRDYTDQLIALCAEEAEEYKKKLEENKKKDPEDTSTQHQVKQPDPPVTEQEETTVPPKQEKPVPPKRGQRGVERSSNDGDSYQELLAKTFPGLDKIPEDEEEYFYEIFDGFNDKGEPVWKDAPGGIAACNGEGYCGRNTYQPASLRWCVYCGYKFPS